MKFKRIAACISLICMLVSLSGNYIIANANVEKDSGISVSTTGYNYIRYATTIKSYLVNCGNGNLMRVQSDGSNVYAEYYNSDFNVIQNKNIEKELPIFGGFYEGKDAYYIVSGQNNHDESADVECFRITKYDKNWNRITSTGLYDCNTYSPFEAGSLRMAEASGYLFIRTSHTMYKSGDGYHHQANVTIQIDEKAMKITDSFTEIANIGYGYVSHSFNQFIKTENNHIVAVDHGDAYPRSIVLVNYNTDFSKGQFASNINYWKGTRCSATDLLSIAGATGNNTTNVSVGGFEITNSTYIVAVTTIDQSSDGYIRNICVLVKNKSDNTVSNKWITNYGRDDYSATTPHLVKMNDNKYLLIWGKGSDKNGTVYYTFIDSNGNQISDICSMKGEISQCEPVLYGNTAVWYTANKNKVTFYGINENGTIMGQGSIKELADSKYDVEYDSESQQNVVSGIKDNTHVSDFIDELSGSDNILIKDVNGNVLNSDDKITTGCKIYLNNDGSVIDSATLIIKGDTDGNGLIDVLDMEAIQKDILGISSLSGVYRKAALITDSEEISVLDMEAIQKDILGIESIN